MKKKSEREEKRKRESNYSEGMKMSRERETKSTWFNKGPGKEWRVRD